MNQSELLTNSNAIPTASTPEELEALLNESGAEEEGEEQGEGDEGKQGEGEGEPPKPKTQIKPSAQPKAQPKVFNQEPKDGSTKPEEGEEEGEEEEEGEPKYSNLIEYLNEKHTLNLNLKEVPQDLSREQEAEFISSVIDRMTHGVNRALAEYKQIDELLQDNEVRLVLEAKAKGLSLKDITAEYQKSTDGMTADDLVLDDFKRRYPRVKPDVIAKMVDSAKKSGEFDSIAESIRESRKAEELEDAKHNQELQQQQAEEEELANQQQVQIFQQKLGSVKNVYGIPLDDQMRAEIFAAATQRDERGLTYLDQALQSDEGVMLATLGLLHLERLINANASIKANRKSKNFIDRILDSPDGLQQASSKREDDGFDPDLANRF